MAKHILTVDVEDNFTYEELVNKSDWSNYEAQVVNNTIEVLDLLEKYKSQATFFIVGYVAKRHPELVNYIAKKGHEVASHSYWHKPLNTLSIEEIDEDIRRSKEILESIVSTNVIGYRSMKFILPERIETFWKFLKKYGYKYYASARYAERTIIKKSNGIYEVIPSHLSVFGKKAIFSGGAYFRLLPIRFIKVGFAYYTKNRNPICLYIHPWEFNKNQPKRNVPLIQRILQSPLTFNTKEKLQTLLCEYQFTSIKDILGL